VDKVYWGNHLKKNAPSYLPQGGVETIVFPCTVKKFGECAPKIDAKIT